MSRRYFSLPDEAVENPLEGTPKLMDGDGSISSGYSPELTLNASEQLVENSESNTSTQLNDGPRMVKSSPE